MQANKTLTNNKYLILKSNTIPLKDKIKVKINNNKINNNKIKNNPRVSYKITYNLINNNDLIKDIHNLLINYKLKILMILYSILM